MASIEVVSTWCACRQTEKLAATAIDAHSGSCLVRWNCFSEKWQSRFVRRWRRRKRCQVNGGAPSRSYQFEILKGWEILISLEMTSCLKAEPSHSITRIFPNIEISSNSNLQFHSEPLEIKKIQFETFSQTIGRATPTPSSSFHSLIRNEIWTKTKHSSHRGSHSWRIQEMVRREMKNHKERKKVFASSLVFGREKKCFRNEAICINVSWYLLMRYCLISVTRAYRIWSGAGERDGSGGRANIF